MRLPSFPSVVRTLYAFSNTTLRVQPFAQRALSPITRATARSMPSIPFLGALFGTSSAASEKMTYPDSRSDNEWQAQLSPGKQ